MTTICATARKQTHAIHQNNTIANFFTPRIEQKDVLPKPPPKFTSCTSSTGMCLQDTAYVNTLEKRDPSIIDNAQLDRTDTANQIAAILQSFDKECANVNFKKGIYIYGSRFRQNTFCSGITKTVELRCHRL